MHFTSLVLAALTALQPVMALNEAQRIDEIMEDTVAKTHKHLGYATQIITHGYKGDGKFQATNAAEGVDLGSMYDEVASLLGKVPPQNCNITLNNMNEMTGELVDIRPVYIAIADRAPMRLRSQSGGTIKQEIAGYLASDVTHFKALGSALAKRCRADASKIQRDVRVGGRALSEMQRAYAGIL